MNILLAGKDNSITNTIREMLNSIDEWMVTTLSSLQAIEQREIDSSSFDVVLANLTGFLHNPRQVVRILKTHFSSTPLLVFYSYDQKILINPLLEAGARGYLQNGSSEDDLFEATKTVASGKKYIKTEEFTYVE